MDKLGHIESHEYAVICEHLTFLESSIDLILSDFIRASHKEKSKYIKGQTAYWRNVLSGLKWARSIAGQRMESDNAARKSAVYNAGPDNSDGRHPETWELFTESPNGEGGDRIPYE